MYKAIQRYYNELDKAIRYSGTKRERTVRAPFQNLLNYYAETKKLFLALESPLRVSKGKTSKTIWPDGTLKDRLQQNWGYLEDKDEADNLDREIENKFLEGYPNDNILFENGKEAILIQEGDKVMDIRMKEPDKLDRLITRFVSFEPPSVKKFHESIKLFKKDIPEVTETIRQIINDAKDKTEYIKAFDDFLSLCKKSINPNIKPEDVNEMIIQHILTKNIFNIIFDEIEFHRNNNIACKLEEVINVFFTRDKWNITFHKIKHYYDAINTSAAQIADHHEKQKFLKIIYEEFYKSYNPKASDRLGVVYTPNEIVQFMVKATDDLLKEHFNKSLEDRNVEILDPTTGTGTFVCELIEHIRTDKLEHKYRNEISANEVAILPYYISNLNIEYTYSQKMDNKYVAFKNLCFLDTLDTYEGKQGKFDFFSEENSKRIQEQKKKKIAVIIGNPPYNVGQSNYSDNNANRKYPELDKRINGTFVKYSTAQKTKVYDMYTRFYRWAFDRLDKENGGIIAFITNNSFIDATGFDGFRKCIQEDFNNAYIVDLGGNSRVSSDVGNVFGIRVGVAIMFLIKKPIKNNTCCKIQIFALEDSWKKEQKLKWLGVNSLETIAKDSSFKRVCPDKHNNWINSVKSNFKDLLSFKDIFSLHYLGVSTNRDEWVYDSDKENLINKMKYFENSYNQSIGKFENDLDTTIKWSGDLKEKLRSKKKINFDENKIIKSAYRPFVSKYYYSEKIMSDRLTDRHYQSFGKDLKSHNFLICVSSNREDFYVLSSRTIIDLHFIGDTQCFPLYHYDFKSQRLYNVTDSGGGNL